MNDTIVAILSCILTLFQINMTWPHQLEPILIRFFQVRQLKKCRADNKQVNAVTRSQTKGGFVLGYCV